MTSGGGGGGGGRGGGGGSRNLFKDTHVKISHLVTSLPTSRQQVWNNLLTTCNNRVEIISLVARLF